MRLIGESLRTWKAAMIFAAVLVVSTSLRAHDPAPGQTFQDCDNCSEMVVIPAGSFLMGSPDGVPPKDITHNTGYNFFMRVLNFVGGLPGSPEEEAAIQEHPQHKVDIANRFAIGKYPVTRREFEYFVERSGYVPSGGCHPAGGRGAPRALVTWVNPGFMQSVIDPVVCVSWFDAQAYIRWLNSRLNIVNGEMDNYGPYRFPTEAEWEYAARAGTTAASACEVFGK